MPAAPQKRFFIKAPTTPVTYWLSSGRGNTTNMADAYRYPQKEAMRLKEVEPLLELIPV